MTILVTNGDVMVADRTTMKNGLALMQLDKIEQYKIGSRTFTWGSAGTLSEIRRVNRFLRNLFETYGMELDLANLKFPNVETEEVWEAMYKDFDTMETLIVVSDDHSVHAYNIERLAEFIKVTFPSACGHADTVAVVYGALKAGASPTDALKIGVDATLIAKVNSDKDLQIVPCRNYSGFKSKPAKR